IPDCTILNVLERRIELSLGGCAVEYSVIQQYLRESTVWRRKGKEGQMFRIMVRVIARGVYGTMVVVCLALTVSSAQAAGLYLYENGTADLGTAAAGRAAAAQDASTVVGNPAGMTRLERSQLTNSLYTLIPSMQFDRNGGTTFSGGNGFNAGAPIPSNSSVSLPVPAGALFYVYSLSPDWKLGVGAVSAYGGGMNYGKQWVGRYFIEKSQLLSATLNPGI